MLTSRDTRWLVCAAVLPICLNGVVALAKGPAPVAIQPDRPTCMYDVGERVGWTLTSPAAGMVRYSAKKNGAVEVASGELDLAAGPARVELTLTEPAMVLLEVQPTAGSAAPQLAAAAVAPTQLKPVLPKPDDFDNFWQAKIEELHSVPAEPALVRGGSGGVPGVAFATITMNNIRGAKIHGQLAHPDRPGKFPALLILQWASPPYPLEKVWVTQPATQGWLALNVEPHDVLPDQSRAYYDALPDEQKHYESLGHDDREQSHFLKMYLGDYRAIDYLTEHPAWDGKTLVVMGTSMGGQQSLCVSGLHPRVTHMIVNVPAGCDLNAALHGRAAGYPFFRTDDPKVMETARYLDAVNFAPGIKARSLVALGFVDTVCPPAGIWTAFNQISGPKLAAPMPDSPHNHQATAEQQRPYTDTSDQWLKTLAAGGEVLEEGD